MYTVDIVDANGCTAQQSATIAASSPIDLAVYVSDYGDVNIPCSGASTGVHEAVELRDGNSIVKIVRPIAKDIDRTGAVTYALTEVRRPATRSGHCFSRGSIPRAIRISSTGATISIMPFTMGRPGTSRR